jgi:serine phosphatase RsbU (regulator of sigma subunit)
MPVGEGQNKTSFTLHSLEFEKGDSLYLYTDGYADQFGGPKGKKFMNKQLNELIISISNLPATKQSDILNHKFEDWKGNTDQVDDMLIIGVQL